MRSHQVFWSLVVRLLCVGVILGVRPAPAAAQSATLPVNFNANLFPFIAPTSLRAGDTAMGQAVRGSPTVPLTRAKFLAHGVNRLNTISAADTKRLGLLKSLDFSAVADLSYLNDPALPKDLTIVNFNFEGGMTPSVDYTNPVVAVTKFAAIVHAHGYRMGFTPIYNNFHTMMANGTLAKILPVVDFVTLQMQNQVARLGAANVLTEWATDHAFVRAHSAARLVSQLWTPTETCAQQVTLFAGAQKVSSLDVAQVGTHSGTNGPATACVIKGLRP